MTKRALARVASLACMLCIASCSSAPALTQIMVMVRSNVEALDQVQIRVEGLGKLQTATADVSKQKLPRTLAVVYRGGPLGPITIRARGLNDGNLVVERAARLSFVRGHDVTLVLDLVAACGGLLCSGKNETCVDGGCTDNAIDSKKLKDWPGSVGKVSVGTIYVDADAGVDGGDALDAAADGSASQDSGGDVTGQDAGSDSGAAITGCDKNHVDCNHDRVCETAITTLEDCGGCGEKCEFDSALSDPQGTLSCPQRVCKVSCPTDRIDLDGKPQTGCEGEEFPLVASHVDVDDPALRAKAVGDLAINCVGALDFGSGALPASVAVCGTKVHPLLVHQAAGPDIVVVSVATLSVAAGETLTLAGTRPVAFVVFGDATIAGTISVSAVGGSAGPGGNTSCTTGTGVAGVTAGSGNPMGSGGGGGGFGIPGAAGGDADNGAKGAASGGVDGDAALVSLRGGCPGGAGGAGSSVGGLAGGGGGALQLSVAGTLTVTGTISAAGGGGQPPITANIAGAGGGGSGGAILLEAGMLDLQASSWIAVNGGGGGESASNSAIGGPGDDGIAGAATPALGGHGVAAYAGDGGNGAAGATSPTAGKTGSNNGSFPLPPASNWGGGGGGGGGMGRVVLRGVSCNTAGGISPAAVCM